MELPTRMVAGDIILSRWRVADAEKMHDAVVESADHLRPWLPWIAHEPQPLESRQAMLSAWEKASETGEAYYAILSADIIAGSSSLLASTLGTLEMGYWVGTPFLRRGFATTTARLLTDAAFGRPDVVAVEIVHDKANKASEGVPRRLGYRLVDERQVDPQAPADVGIDRVWRIERADWSALDDPPQLGATNTPVGSMAGKPLT